MTLDPSVRGEVERTTGAARKSAGDQAAGHWMKGWKMNVAEILAFATGETEE